MGAVAVDSQGVVWAGTGEVDHGGGSAYYGKGIYKSTDDGATWTNMGLEDGDTIGQIVIDPRDDDRVFVAVMGALHDTEPTRGLFLTEDGGASWTRVIVPESASTGAIDVSINKTNPDVMLATTWDKIRDEKSRIYGPHSYVYRSTDGGRTWVNVHNAPLPQSETDPALQTPDNLVGRMGVDFSDSDPNRAYLISSTARGNFNGFFTSTDAGATWTAVGPTSGGTLQSISGGFAWWFGRVYVDPVNPQHVFVAGVSLAESLNGGPDLDARRNTVARRPARPRVRPVHAGQGPPRQRRRLLLVDGERRRARALVQDPAPARDAVLRDGRLRPGRLARQRRLPGQRLAEVLGPDNTVNGDWFSLLGGDGMMNRIDPTNDRKYYACSQNGGCRGFVGTATGQTSFSMAFPGADRKNWVTPIEFAADPNFMFGASQFVYRMNTEPGVGQRVWQRLSPDLTEGTEPRAPGFGTVTALGTTTADPNLVYAGTDSGLMWVSRNAMAARRPGDVDEAREPGVPGPLGHPRHRRPAEREGRVGDLLGLALG